MFEENPLRGIADQVETLLDTVDRQKDTISVLEKARDILGEETRLLRHETNNLQTDLKRARDDRDFFMTQNAELKTLLSGAAALIVEGSKKLALAESRRSAIEKPTQQESTNE